jgi:hypothetical protein
MVVALFRIVVEDASPTNQLDYKGHIYSASELEDLADGC